MEPLPPGKKGDRGRTAKNNRPILEAILRCVRNIAPWRGIPEHFGKWNSLHRSFRRWVKFGVFERIHRESRGKIDLECAMIDGTTAQAHGKASGAGKVLGKQAIDRPRGGLIAKGQVLTDTHGRLVDFRPLPGQAHELTGTRHRLKGASFRALTADGAFDAERLLADLGGGKQKL